jgi:hypothetical protein
MLNVLYALSAVMPVAATRWASTDGTGGSRWIVYESSRRGRINFNSPWPVMWLR